MKILGIESSCDETAAAVVEDGRRLLSNVVHSQIDIHTMYGGVVPEIAARSHIEMINPVINKALEDARLTWDEIDGIAVTYAPGLVGSLLVGTLAARTLALLKNKPLYPIHHVEAHVYANFLNET
ncbi:MAG: tRNA (adenosine(37)-N6)-threonylcarbamoyltransferase complex transferase subunit TsaD, partial [Candidatus Saccharibacteria bacterium]